MPNFDMANPGLLRALQPQPYDPAPAMKQAQAYLEQREQQREKEAAQQREAMIAEVVQAHPNDPDKAIGILKARDWKAAMVVEDAVNKNRKAIADRRKVEIENELGQMTVNRGGLSAKDALEAELAAITRGQVEDWARLMQTNPSEGEKAGMVLMGPEKWAAMQAKIRDQDITMRGQDVSAETARSGQQVTMRGQDIGASTARRGQDITARGQDIAASTAAARLELDKAQTGGAGGAKLSATAIEKIAGVDQSMGMLDDIERLLPGMSSNIGPIDGRVVRAKLLTGKGVTPDLAAFDAQLTGLKNAVIKATTGAAMSEPEAKRIMGQLPDLTNPESVFKARLATTRKNLETLKRRTIELSGGRVDEPSKPSAPNGGKPADPLGIR